MRAVQLADSIQPPDLIQPAHEFSGVVAPVGEEVGSLEIGQDVYGMSDGYTDGAMAEYCIAPFFAVATKPRRLTHVEAASVPIGALTAWQVLVDHAKLQPGERVLVHGGAGAVGVFAVQLARLHGAHVIATASARNRDCVSSLGAEQVTDYRESRFEERVQGLILEPNQKQLAEAAVLLDSEQIRPVVDAVIPLSQAPEAYAGRIARQGRGKLVVAVANMN